LNAALARAHTARRRAAPRESGKAMPDRELSVFSDARNLR
jgi:hypothetical protein